MVLINRLSLLIFVCDYTLKRSSTQNDKLTVVACAITRLFKFNFKKLCWCLCIDPYLVMLIAIKF